MYDQSGTEYNYYFFLGLVIDLGFLYDWSWIKIQRNNL